MIGLGTQDGIEMAEDFVDDHDVNFRMLWDPGFDSWVHYGIRGQPAAVLLDAEGGAIKGWRGLFSEDEVLELVASET